MSRELDRLAECVAAWNREMVDGETIAKLANVADELIAVARAADDLTFTPGIEQLRPLRNALHALHAKLAEGGTT